MSEPKIDGEWCMWKDVEKLLEAAPAVEPAKDEYVADMVHFKYKGLKVDSCLPVLKGTALQHVSESLIKKVEPLYTKPQPIEYGIIKWPKDETKSLSVVVKVSDQTESLILTELLEVVIAMRDWIDSVPPNIQLPVMPGFDRDWADEVIEKASGR